MIYFDVTRICFTRKFGFWDKPPFLGTEIIENDFIFLLKLFLNYIEYVTCVARFISKYHPYHSPILETSKAMALTLVHGITDTDIHCRLSSKIIQASMSLLSRKCATIWILLGTNFCQNQLPLETHFVFVGHGTAFNAHFTVF